MLRDGLHGPACPAGGHFFISEFQALHDIWTNRDQYTIIIGHTSSPQPWTASTLTITPHSLGAVTIGMTLAQASAAAGETLAQVGDGMIYPRGNQATPGLSMGPGDSPGKTQGCVAASLASNGPTVVTPQGFRLGGTVAQLKAVYGSNLRYVSPPTFQGITPPPGYIASYPDGNLAFGISGNTVQTIAGGPGILSIIGC